MLTILLLAAASPAASQTTPRAIAETADISGLATSPDGRWVAYRIERPSTATNRIDVDWHLIAANGRAAPISLGRLGTAMWSDAGSILPGEAQWSPDSKQIVVRALVDGRVALWASAIDGSGFRLVAAGDGDIERFKVTADGWLVTSEGPSRDLIARTEEAERESGILVDQHTDLAQPLFRGATINGRAASQRFSGDWFDRTPLLAKVPRAIEVRSLLTGTARAATAHEVAAVTTVEGTASAQEPTAIETRYIESRVDGDGAAPRLSSRLKLPDGRAVITLRDSFYRQSLHIWSPDERRFELLASSEGLLSGSRSESAPCAATGEAIFCVEAAPAMPPRLVRIDLDGAKTVIVSPNPDPVGDGLLADTIAWPVSGSRASGVLIRPKIPGRLPLFITYYRCAGYLRGGLGDEWPLRALAANGIAALCINAIPKGDTAERRFTLGLEAVQGAIDLLSERGVVDRDRVGMGGLSFGSEVAMWTAIHSDLLKAVSIASVQMGPAYYWFNARPGREMFAENLLRYYQLGSPDDDAAGWKRMSPALNIDRIHIPVLMQLPEHEARLSVELQSQLALARLGELHIFPFAPHIKVEPRQKLAAYQRNLDWFRYWLTGAIDPDPAKLEQYQRWAELRPERTAGSAARTQRSRSAISISRK